jgi:hypothetical protein
MMPYTPGDAGQCSRIDCLVAALLASRGIVAVWKLQAVAHELGPKPSKSDLSWNEITMVPDAKTAQKRNQDEKLRN